VATTDNVLGNSMHASFYRSWISLLISFSYPFFESSFLIKLRPFLRCAFVAFGAELSGDGGGTSPQTGDALLERRKEMHALVKCPSLTVG